MSREPASRDQSILARRDQGLRLAFAVALGLVFEILRGALVPPLAAVIALQLLTLPGPRPTAKKAIGVFVVIAGATLFAYGVSALTADSPWLYVVGVGLIYLWGFALAVRPKTAAAGAMILTMGIVVTTLAAVSTMLAAILVAELLVSVSVGIALVFLVHAAFPRRAPVTKPEAAAEAGPVGGTGRRAIAATLIILPLHLLLTADGFAAMVVLLTVATMLRQQGIAQSTSHAVSFGAGNLLGGLLAAVAVTVVGLHDTVPVLATVTAAFALFIAWQMERAPALTHVLLPGFVAFALLFGVAFSPLSLSADVDLLKRLAQIAAAGLYALAAISLFLPFGRVEPPPRGPSTGMTTTMQS